MLDRASRMICWPEPDRACLQGDCLYCYAGRRIKFDTLRRYAKSNGWGKELRYGTRNPKVEWQEP